MALSGSVFEIWHVTDRQTDGQTDRHPHRFMIWPRVLLSVFNWKNLVNGMGERFFAILKTSMRSEQFLLSSRDHRKHTETERYWQPILISNSIQVNDYGYHHIAFRKYCRVVTNAHLHFHYTNTIGDSYSLDGIMLWLWVAVLICWHYSKRPHYRMLAVTMIRALMFALKHICYFSQLSHVLSHLICCILDRDTSALPHYSLSNRPKRPGPDRNRSTSVLNLRINIRVVHVWTSALHFTTGL